jgi:hypothetical protein
VLDHSEHADEQLSRPLGAGSSCDHFLCLQLVAPSQSRGSRRMLATTATKEATMAVFMGAFPVLEGKEDDARKFARETLDRRDELDESQERIGVTKEEWSLQQTPMGSFVVVRFESDDVEGAFADLAQSDEPFDVWFRERVKEVSGMDLGAPMPGPLPEIILDWSA